MQIQEIMSTPAFTCRATDTLNVAAALMWEHDCGAVPVVDDAGSLAGIITDRDICMATYTQGRAPQQIPISDAMANQVFSCRASDSLASAEALMSAKQVRRIPVVDGNNQPIGLVSLNDLARAAAGSRKREVPEREIVQTLAAVGQPRPHASPSATQAHSQALVTTH